MVESPCEKICYLDSDDVCIGCKRTRDEIRMWMKYTDEEKLQVIENCKKRKQEDNYERYV